VGSHRRGPDLWGFCGAKNTQPGKTSRPPGAPGQRQRRGVPGRTWPQCELQHRRGSCGSQMLSRTAGTCMSCSAPVRPAS